MKTSRCWLLSGLNPWRWLVAGVAIVVTAQVAAKASQPNLRVADAVRYQCPAGWTEREEGDVCVLTARAEKPGEVLVVFISSTKPRGNDLAAQLQSLANTVETKAKRLARGPIQSAKRGTLAALMMTGRVDLPGVGVHDRLYELVSDEHHSVFVMALMRGPATVSAHQTELAALLAGVAPKSDTDDSGTRPLVPLGETSAGTTQPVVSGAAGIPYGGPAVVVLDKAFHPSGHGLPLPAPEIKNGAPNGVWWYLRITTAGSSIMCDVFLPDGTLLGVFRPGGPALVDIDGMRALGETDFIGTWRVANRQLTMAWGPGGQNVITKPLDIRQSGGVPSFIWWQREYQPSLLIDRSWLIGTWREGAMGTFRFNADGTVVTKPNMIDASWGRTDAEETITGTWVLDGYILAMHFPKDGDRVMTAFRTAHGELVLRQSILTRE